MKWYKLTIIIILTAVILPIYAQIEVPQHQRGSPAYRKKGIHNGNLVETLFYNFGEVAWWGQMPSGVWPRGSNHSYMDGITPLVVTEIENNKGELIHVCEASYRELMPVSADGVDLGWQPRPGYANPNQDKIAMSDNPNSWPEQWADKDASWSGFWNG